MNEANNEPSVRSPTVVASEPDKKVSEVGLGLSGQQLVDLITRLTKDSDGEKPRTKEAETIKLNDMPAPEAYTVTGATMSGTRSSRAPTNLMRLGFGSMKSLTIRPHGTSLRKTAGSR